MTNSLRIISYNIHKGKGPLEVARALKAKNIHHSSAEHIMQQITERLLNRQPDIITCQEVAHRPTQHKTPQHEQLAENLNNFAHSYGANAFTHGGHHGNATFSTHPISHDENFNISTNRLEKRGALHTIIHPKPGVNLHVFNVHFGLNTAQRRKQAKILCDLIDSKTHHEDPLIIAGDMNDWNHQLSQIFYKNHSNIKCIQDKNARTWPTQKPLLALDRIYTRHLHLTDVTIHADAQWKKLSDHFPIEATVTLQ